MHRRIAATHPAPEALHAQWRARGVWTDETLLDRFVAADANHLALVDSDERISILSLRATAAGYAATLRELGVGLADIVCWQLPNWWEAVAFCWGVWALGAVASPITPTLRAREVGFILEQTSARVIAVPANFRGTDHRELVDATGFDGDVVVVRAGDERPREEQLTIEAGVTAADPAVVLWTSGTTADPKGVVHTHQSLRAEADSITAAHQMRPGESLLLPMPVTHVAGLTYGVLLPVTSEITTVLMDTWQPARALELVEREHIGVMISTPIFMRTMIDDSSFARTDTSSVRLFSLGGAGVAPEMVREGASRFGCWCKRTYGSTEYPTLTTGRAGDDPERDATTDGPIIAAGELRVVDPSTLAEVSPSQSGELLVRGPEMFSGYLDHTLDRAAFIDGGWFRTGDLAVFDGEYLTIVDRLKDIIIRGGENISAQEVEAALASHPAVAEAACIAVPDAVMGEKVCAYVIPRDGARPALDDLRAHLLALGLARFKVPERLELRTTLPRTASGKVQKATLRAEASAGE